MSSFHGYSATHKAIAAELVSRGINVHVADVATDNLIAWYSMSLINVQSAYKLGRGISWDCIADAVGKAKTQLGV